MNARTAVTGVQLGGAPDLPLLVCGPSLGTSGVALWSATAQLLSDAFHVVAWDLPGHGRNLGPPGAAFTIAELAAGVLALVDELRGPGTTFVYAGDSVGGTVGLQLLLDAPGRVSTAALLCSGARIGDPTAWRERAELVAASGTSVMLEGSAKRWFSPGFAERDPATAAALLHSLELADRTGYALTCEALARFDVRDRLAEISAPVLAIAGADDAVTTPAVMREIVDGVPDGRLVVLAGVAHLAPAEAPAEVAQLLRQHFAAPAQTGDDERYRAGLAVRRAVLGDAHVDRSLAAATDLTAEFQRFITEYAWGTIWTRPGLDRRSRSMITLTALVARGHHEELALHLRAARTNGLTDAEITELLLQTAIYCGVPDANTAFRIARETLEDS